MPSRSTALFALLVDDIDGRPSRHCPLPGATCRTAIRVARRNHARIEEVPTVASNPPHRGLTPFSRYVQDAEGNRNPGGVGRLPRPVAPVGLRRDACRTRRFRPPHLLVGAERAAGPEVRSGADGGTPGREAGCARRKACAAGTIARTCAHWLQRGRAAIDPRPAGQRGGSSSRQAVALPHRQMHDRRPALSRRRDQATRNPLLQGEER